MIKGIEEYYQIIADAVVDALPEEWETVTSDAAFFEDMRKFTSEYKVPGDARPRDLLTPKAARDALVDIRDLFKEAGKKLWGRARFEMNSAGQFNLTWNYDDCDERGFARWDEEAERKRDMERNRRLDGG